MFRLKKSFLKFSVVLNVGEIETTRFEPEKPLLSVLIKLKMPNVHQVFQGDPTICRRQRKKYVNTYLPWAIETGLKSQFLMNVYFENRWDQTVSDLYKELNIKPAPAEERFFSVVSN